LFGSLADERNNKMKVGKVWKTGNSVVVTIDTMTLNEAKLKIGDLVETIVNEKKEITLKKVGFSERKN